MDMRIPRTFFAPEHEAFRDQVRKFLATEVAPRHSDWEADHRVPREVWQAAGAQGMLCCWVSEDNGGPGADLLCDVIVSEELSRIGATGPGFSLHSLVVAPYLAHYGTAELCRRLLPRMASGSAIGAIAMTEPGAGSDLAAIRTRAVQQGDEWVIDGQKTFITNGQNCDVMVVACKTDPELGARGVSLFVVEADMPGFSRGRNLHKMGQHAQDTAELHFNAVRVPASHLLGEPGQGFAYMMRELPQERLAVSLQCQARAEAVLAWTIEYVRQRKAFDQRIADFQNTRFTLADLWTQVQAGRAYCDSLIELHLQGRLAAASAAASKLFHSELLGRVVDACVQLHGGYGYMMEYPIARAYVDARIERIYAGSSEIMKEVIARSLLDPPRR